jgi:hypothetical protein
MIASIRALKLCATFEAQAGQPSTSAVRLAATPSRQASYTSMPVAGRGAQAGDEVGPLDEHFVGVCLGDAGGGILETPETKK